MAYDSYVTVRLAMLSSHKLNSYIWPAITTYAEISTWTCYHTSINTAGKRTQTLYLKQRD